MKIWYFVTKIVLTYCEKKLVYVVIEKKKFKKFEITRTICSNSERSEQLLVTECFFKLFLEVRIRTIRIQIEKKNIGI